MTLSIDPNRVYITPIWWIVIASCVVMTALQASPTPWQHALRYDRDAVSQGEIWRIITGHFLHLGWSHLALNLAGLLLGTWLFSQDRTPRQWLLATFVTALACGLGLWLWSPQVAICVGLSGVLHGFMIIGFGGWALEGERRALIFLALVIGKMAWEQTGGTMPWEAAMAGGAVITDAHVWGALGGGAYLVGEAIWRARHRTV